MNSIAEVLPRDMYYGSALVASILGLEGAFGSRYSVWDRMLNGHEDTVNDYMKWGVRLEDDILEEYEEQDGSGKIVALQAHYAYPEWPKARATLDAVALVDGERVVVEAKSSGDWDWDEVPLAYEAQVQWQLGCAGLKRAHLIVWFRTTCKPKMFVIDFQPQVFAQMIEAVQTFDTNHVLTGIPPEVDGHSATTEALKRIKGNGQVAAIDQVAGDVVLLGQIKEAIKSLESQEEEVSNRIKAALGECEKGTVNGAVVVTWGNRSSSRFDQKTFKADHSDLASKYIVTSVYRDGLRFKKQKEAVK